MLISSIFGSPVVLASKSPFAQSFKPCNGEINSNPLIGIGSGNGGLVIEGSSRPKKKATAHHMKTRPKKSQPWDIKRKPTVYPPLPPLPPDWTLVSPAEDSIGNGGSEGDATESPLPSSPALEAPVTSG